MTGTWTRWLALVWVAALLLAGAAATGCGDDNGNGEPTLGIDDFTPIPVTETAEAYPLTIMRSDGKPLTLDEAPSRVVSLSPGATEIVYAIGAEGALVAVDLYSDFPQAAADFPTKVDAYEPNIEAITALEPDLVIVASDVSGIVQKLDELGIPVLYQDIDTSIRTIEDVLGQIAIMGRVFDRREQAGALVEDLGTRLNRIRQELRSLDSAIPLKVFHELDETLFTVSENSFIGDLYRTLRVRNIAGDGGGQAYPQLTQEAIISANPDIIVLADEGFGVTIESVKARPGWDAISAVQNDRIVAIDPNIISRPGPRIIDALEELARQIYPDRFS